MRRILPVSILLTLAAGLGVFGAAGAGGAGGAGRQVAVCDPADPPSCAYVPERVYDVGEVRGQLVDDGRDGYPVPLVIHYPLLDEGDDEARPVVIWHHGGGPSPNGADRSENWGRELAAAGYVAVHPSRVPIQDATPFEDDCRTNGFADPDTCAHWQANFRYGPQTTRFLIANLEGVEWLDPALDGLLDETRIVVGGHSAGSTAPLANAGAWQQWETGTVLIDERVDEPVAFMATGVQGPMYAGFPTGFQPDSFAGIDRPFLSITGVGDETGEPPETRVTNWLTSVGDGDKVLSWDTEPRAVHETMNIRKCDTEVRAAHCDWIADIGIAFLDAAVQHRAEARDWLDSDAVEVLTGGAIEIHRR